MSQHQTSLSRLWSIIVSAATKHVVGSILGMLPTSLVITWIITAVKHRTWLPDIELSPEFWLTLTVLSALTVFYHFVLRPRRLARERQQERMLRLVEEAYEAVERIFEPGILNPASPGNPVYMRKAARDAVDLLVPHLEAQGVRHPGLLDPEAVDSVSAWQGRLRELRMKLNADVEEAAGKPRFQ